MDLKVSHYIVCSEPFSETTLESEVKKQLVFSTRSLQILLLSEKVCGQLIKGEILDLPENLIDQLVEAKILVPCSENELQIIIEENKRFLKEESLLYFVVQPTAYCQLGCDYCGQEHIKHNLEQKDYALLLKRIAKKFIPGQHRHLKIGWFGGEPLVGLPQIRALTPLFKEFCEKNEITYSSKIVTNGLSLKENVFEELICELNCREMEITLDGIAEFHDQRRHTKLKEKTFDIIYNNLKRIIDREDFLQLNCKLSIRCNVDKRNWEGVSPLIQLLGENGFANKIAYFYPIGVYSWGNDAHLGSLTKEEFAAKELDWLIEMIHNGFKPSLLPGRVRQVCLAVSPSSEMVDAYGNVFNCTEVSYVPKYKESGFVLGNIKDQENILSHRPLMDWNDKILRQETVSCSNCNMLPVCGGACPKSWGEGMRACPSNKFNIKEKMMLSYLATKENFINSVKEIAEM